MLCERAGCPGTTPRGIRESGASCRRCSTATGIYTRTALEHGTARGSGSSTTAGSRPTRGCAGSRRSFHSDGLRWRRLPDRRAPCVCGDPMQGGAGACAIHATAPPAAPFPPAGPPAAGRRTAQSAGLPSRGRPRPPPGKTGDDAQSRPAQGDRVAASHPMPARRLCLRMRVHVRPRRARAAPPLPRRPAAPPTALPTPLAQPRRRALPDAGRRSRPPPVPPSPPAAPRMS